MKDIWDFLQGLFQKAETSSSSNPYIHELIARPPADKPAFEAWKTSLACRRLVDWLDNQYALWLALPSDIDEALDFLDTPSSKGFVVHLRKTTYQKQEITYFLTT